MKKFLVVLLMVFGLVTPVHASDVELEKTTVDATIHNNGKVTITETWQIDFDGEFSRYERIIPINDGERITDIHIYIDGKEAQPLSYDDGARPSGTYYVDQTNDEMILAIYMRARYETKTFLIEYTTNKATMCYKDVLEFNYNMIGDDWDYDMGFVSGTITFPQVPSQNEDIYVWGHGPANGNVNITSATSVYYECEDFPANTNLNIRLLLPSELFTVEKINKEYLDEIVQEETKYAKQEANRQKWERIKMYISGGLGSVLGLGSIIYLWIKRRNILKEIQPALTPEYYRELPSDLTPSEVIDLMNYVGHDFDEKNKFASTLMSLSLKGLIEFEQYEEDGLFKTKTKTKMHILQNDEAYAKLKSHETTLYRFIEFAGKDGETTFDEIDELTRIRPRYCKDKLDSFRQSSRASIERDGYLDLRVKTGHLILLSIVVIALGAVSIPFVPFFGIPMTVCGVISILLSGTTKRYTQKGADEVALWEAFERFLKEFTLMDEKELPELVMWEEYLVYATAMGIGEEVLKQLPEKYPDFYESDFYHRSYMRHFYYGRRPNIDVFDHFNDFSTKMNTAMHYTENSGGKGGSFSSGGGGGFAGGGHSSGGGGGRFS